MSNFYPRTSEAGMYGSAYWYDLGINPGAQNYIWLPNCTTYAYGRSAEIAAAGGGSVDYSTIFGGGFRNAASWYYESQWSTSSGLSNVLLGDIICWGAGGGVGSAGHVAVVEGIESGKIWISESHDSTLSQTYSYPGTQSKRYFEYAYLDTATMVIHVVYWYNSGGAYDTHYSTIYAPYVIGTIHNPYAGQDPGPEPPEPPTPWRYIGILTGWKLKKKKGGAVIHV